MTDGFKRSLSRSLIPDSNAANLHATVMQAVNPHIRAATNHLQTSLAELIAQNVETPNLDLRALIATAVAPEVNSVAAGVQASLARAIAPSLEAATGSLVRQGSLANFVIGNTLNHNFTRLLDQGLLDGLKQTAQTHVGWWNSDIRDILRTSWPRTSFNVDFDFAELRRALKLRKVPPNWLDVTVDADVAEASIHGVLDDGIALGWVPNARVVELLLNAADSQARRRVISNNWRGILNDCEIVAGGLPARGALFLADMIRTAIRSLRDGYVEPSQALATNVLDTVVSQFRVPTLRIDKGMLLDPGRVSDLSRHGWRFALSLRPVNSAMTGRFTLDHRGTSFKRNATSHAATRQQYNRINAVIAIMLATSVLACYVRDTSAFDT